MHLEYDGRQRDNGKPSVGRKIHSPKCTDLSNLRLLNVKPNYLARKRGLHFQFSRFTDPAAATTEFGGKWHARLKEGGGRTRNSPWQAIEHGRAG